jgi:hypothetical protein
MKSNLPDRLDRCSGSYGKHRRSPAGPPHLPGLAAGTLGRDAQQRALPIAAIAAFMADESTRPRCNGMISQDSITNLVMGFCQSSILPSAVALRGWIRTYIAGPSMLLVWLVTRITGPERGDFMQLRGVNTAEHSQERADHCVHDAFPAHVSSWAEM